jgi:copper homeostasis protein
LVGEDKEVKRIIEVCANSVHSCVEAEVGGAVRAELCAGIPEGGTTPSYGQMVTARAKTSSLRIHAIIRPRGGDFLYTEVEIEAMLADIRLCRRIGIDGIATGCLTKEGEIDTGLLHRLKEAAGQLSFTFHRAFDACRDPFDALEKLIDAGCDRVLTSGRQPTAEAGAPLIAELVKQAAGRICIMPGSGIRPDNIARIQAATGTTEFHASARLSVPSEMEYDTSPIPVSYDRSQTNQHLVRHLVETPVNLLS